MNCLRIVACAALVADGHVIVLKLHLNVYCSYADYYIAICDERSVGNYPQALM